jgi:hypothetical protein
MEQALSLSLKQSILPPLSVEGKDCISASCSSRKFDVSQLLTGSAPVSDSVNKKPLVKPIITKTKLNCLCISII